MEKYMRRAIELAKKGTGFVNPNPLVGAVIVKNNKIIGEGFHAKYGEIHAERDAIRNLTESADGADIYVTLEPCCHHGKNPPCTDAIIASGIKRVFMGSPDPNPLVAGKGIEILRSHGIEVIENVLRDECDALNDIFFHYITTKTPYVILKAAISADGKIAAAGGDSKWITNEKSRAHTHETRKLAAAILVGVDTIIADDPMLNCRADNPAHPIRIICDSHLRTPLNSKIVSTAKDIPTYIAYTDIDTDKIHALEALGVHLINTPEKDGHTDLSELMKSLGAMGIDSVLIEGGGRIHASALNTGIVNKVQIYLAPKLIGADGKDAVAAMGVTLVKNAINLKNPEITRFDDDILIEYEVV
ncbi:MAG: bifunctional diaminohydroxyphosphoribosylaminopyrimidine deaminase/5-amino-6-(5-phosphoribosylamino)uracil reductase RibD [Oscillospiraceae bacterium]|nr:bifunctional diaminohydroxyphosphoribosylaminopyrimidine deaminase/5-amino-6-(5-phosphoribosylamino)uracil reductase RibD [Oscillospiraceae bacterium]